MKAIIILALTFLLLASASYAQENPIKLYKLDLNYNNGTVTIVDLNMTYGYPPDTKIQPEKGYNVTVLSFSNKVLYTYKFEVHTDFFFDTFGDYASGGSVKLTEDNETVLVPYFRNAKSISIYDSNNTRVIFIDTSVAAQVCNNDKLCEAEYDENSDNCPQDCSPLTNYMMFLAFVPIVIFIILLVRARRKK